MGIFGNMVMIHTEHLRKGDESYSIRHDDKGNAIYEFYKDGYYIMFPTLHDFVAYLYLGEGQTERFYVNGVDIDELYESDMYDYWSLKKLAEAIEARLIDKTHLPEVTAANANKIVDVDEHITVFGVEYGIKYHNGYRFSYDSLFNAIEGTEDFDKVDDIIAYYFEDEVFHAHTGEELYEIFDKHS